MQKIELVDRDSLRSKERGKTMTALGGKSEWPEKGTLLFRWEGGKRINYGV